MNKLFRIIIIAILAATNIGNHCIATEYVNPETNIRTEDTIINSQQEERRMYERYNIHSLNKPVTISSSEASIDSLIDISRGGVGLKHNNTLQEGDILPVHITYKDINIDTEIRILNATENRAGGEYINITPSLRNKLLYLSILIEADNKLLKTKLSV